MGEAVHQDLAAGLTGAWGCLCTVEHSAAPLASLPLGAVSAFGTQTVCRLCQVWEQGGRGATEPNPRELLSWDSGSSH